MTKKMLALLLLVLVVAALSLGAAFATGNDCDAPFDVDCHQGHNDAGNPTDPCLVYVDVGIDPPGILCVNVA